MRVVSLALATLTLCLAPALSCETLGNVLAARNVAADNVAANDLEQPITSFAVSADNSPFLIAYYDDDGSGSLPSVLHVLRYDKRTHDLRRTDLHGADVPFHGFHGVMEQVSNTCMGSVLAVSERQGFITIETHINPSAGCVLVLTPDLHFNAGLWGWVLARLDGEIILRDNMIHFAKIHDARLSLYDPRERKTASIYSAYADDARQHFSAELKKHLPSSEWCASENNPCDPKSFSTDIDHVIVHEQERSFEFDARMDADGFGEDAAQSVPPKTVHYICRQSEGRWSLSSK